jgi:hypothetical protein
MHHANERAFLCGRPPTCSSRRDTAALFRPVAEYWHLTYITSGKLSLRAPAPGQGEAQGDGRRGPEALHLYLLDAAGAAALPGVARAAGDEAGGVPDATHGVVSVVG